MEEGEGTIHHHCVHPAHKRRKECNVSPRRKARVEYLKRPVGKDGKSFSKKVMEMRVQQSFPLKKVQNKRTQDTPNHLERVGRRRLRAQVGVDRVVTRGAKQEDSREHKRKSEATPELLLKNLVQLPIFLKGTVVRFGKCGDQHIFRIVQIPARKTSKD
jgi:hypothetical protein